jgi:hypothetical protein
LELLAGRDGQLFDRPRDLRAPEQIARFFDGLRLLEPGLVPCPPQRPDPAGLDAPREMDEFCAVGRKP